MALTTVTLRPTSTSQAGSWTVAPSGTAHAALADGSDTTYVQLTARCRLDSDVLRVGFGTPSIPAGAKVYSVTLRDRIQTVTSGSPQPVCHHWFRCLTGVIQVAGQAQDVHKTFFNSTCPSSTVSAWVDRELGSYTSAPGGQAWDVATNLSGLFYDLGRGDDFAGNLRYSAVFLDVVYQQLSAVTVTGPTGSSTSTRPTVTWTYASPDSQPQQAWRVAIYTAAQVAAVGFTPFTTTPQQASGWVLGEALQWTLNQDIVDGSYAAYVQATSKWAGSGDFPTAIASTTWTRAAAPVTPPPSPVLSSAVFDPTGTGRNALTFAPGGPTPATVVFTVQRSDDNEVTWFDIPRLRYLPANGMTPITDYDYTARTNVIAKYRVIAYTGSPYKGSAAPSAVLSVTPTGDEHALVHPANPLLSTILPVASPKAGDGIKITRRMVQGHFQGIGEAGKVLPIVLQGPYAGYEFELEAIFNRGEPSDDYWAAVDQIVTSGSTLLFKRPNGDQHWVTVGPGASGRDMEESYIPVAGNPTKILQRRLRLTFTEVRSPAFF